MDAILIYEIIVTENKKPEAKFFKDKYINIIKYELHYRIDEDRYWFIKKDGKNKILEEHHTKNGLDKSIGIMRGILKRLKLLKTTGQTIEDNLVSDNKVLETLASLDKNKQEDIRNFKNKNETTKESIDKHTDLSGIFFK